MVSDRQVQVLAKIVEKPRKWAELRKIMDVSEATVGRYLNNLKDEGVIKKGFREEDESVVYEAVPEEIQEHTEYSGIVDIVKKEREVAEDLKEQGFSSSGMTQEDVLEFMKNHQEFFSDLSTPEVEIEDAETLTLEHLKIFLQGLEILTGGESKTVELDDLEFKSASDILDLMPDIDRFEEIFN